MDTGLSDVRVMPQAVTISAAVHAVLVAWALAHERTAPPPPIARAPTPIEIVPKQPAPVEPEPAPIDVAFVDLAAPAAPPPAASAPPPPSSPAAPPRRPAPGTAAIETGRGAAIETAPGTAPEPGAEPGPPGSSYLGMRQGTKVDLALPRGYRDDLDRAPAGTAPAREVEETGALQPSGGGTYRSNQGVFTAKIARDGSVDLKDARNLNVRLALPRPKQLGQALARWYESDKGPDGQRGERSLENSFSGSIDKGRYGQPEDKGDRSKTAVVPVVGGGFDVTDWLMRRNKDDPYAAKKLAFLDATRDERVAIGQRHRAEQLRQTARIVQRNLARLWATTSDPAARKQALFELWDEIADPPADDPVLAEATAAARKQVIGFIRARLPAGSAGAYTASELAALARRKQSQATFAPYD